MTNVLKVLEIESTNGCDFTYGIILRILETVSENVRISVNSSWLQVTGIAWTPTWPHTLFLRLSRNWHYGSPVLFPSFTILTTGSITHATGHGFRIWSLFSLPSIRRAVSLKGGLSEVDTNFGEPSSGAHTGCVWYGVWEKATCFVCGTEIESARN